MAASPDEVTVPSDVSSNPNVGNTAPSASGAQEPHDSMQILLAAVKRRRRSSVFVGPDAAETRASSTPEVASAITEKRRKSITAARRSSITRRSVCSTPHPRLSVFDQVKAVMTNGKATLPQLLDICIRDAASQLCQDQPSQSHFPALKSVLVLNSEQISEEVGLQLAREGVTTASLLRRAPLRTVPPSNACSSRLDDAANTEAGGSHVDSSTKICVETGMQDGHSNTGSDKENVGGSRKRKADDGNQSSSKDDQMRPSAEDPSVAHKRRLICEYERRTEQLRAELKAWKLLKVQRREQHSAVKREYAESRSGQQRIGEEQASQLSVAQAAFLAGAPDYGCHLQQLGRVAQDGLHAVARCEQLVSRLCARRQRLNAAADRAYFLADAAVYGEDQSSLRRQLDEL